jgi:xanthine/CO dehydrogenase XdhC/CoxF family maturation factor
VSKDKGTLDSICFGLEDGGSLAVVTLWQDGAEQKRLVAKATGEIVEGDVYFDNLDWLQGKIRAVSDAGQDIYLLNEPELLGRFDRVVIEVLRPKVRVLVFGAGHVGQAVANIAAMVGYDVTVFDDREEFLGRERFSGVAVEVCLGAYSDLVARASINSRTAIVIVTRGHQYDEICLRGVVRANAAYVGMIGSKRRVISVFKKLVEEGYGERELSKVYAPIGLSIGAKSPQEIALAIVAQIIEVMNKCEEKL